jgi:ubiquinone/menaquinone biosynthesis C-methylase UbiE
MADYTLAVSDVEIARYRMMAQSSVKTEHDRWVSAGVVAGATVADVGCGPAAISVELAQCVRPGGHVLAIERDKSAIAAAREVIRQSGVDNVDLRRGEADATGLAPSSLDVAMMRHVLAHNGGREQAIVDHLASLVRPGGIVYLADVDVTAIRILDSDPDLDDLNEKYASFHRMKGNDPSIGLRLGKLLDAAGLEVVGFDGICTPATVTPGMRPPVWAARQAMLAARAVDSDDLRRWETAFSRLDAATIRPTIFVPLFLALGQRPA